MDKPTHPVDGDTNSSALSASTIEFLTAHGFIRQANDSGLALETVLQGLHSGDGDEQDELTTDDDDDDEQLAAQLIEPKGRNPQQQIFSEKPTGPSTLVEESKALIKREPLPREATLLQDAPKPLLQFSGRDELVMPRASLKDTPNLGRKSTFKPLIAKSHREEAKTLLKALSVPALADTADPPVAVKSIDACLKLGPAASRQLFNESQRILTDVQNIIKTDNPALPPESLLDTPDNKRASPPSPILLPRSPMPLLTELDTGQIEKLDVPKVLQDNLVTLNTPSSHSMSQLMEDMDRWGGGGINLASSPVADTSSSTNVTSPLIASESFTPREKLSQSIRIEYPLKPRNPTASPLKRARFSDETDDEGDSKLVKKNKAPSGTAMVEEISAMTKSNHKLLIPSGIALPQDDQIALPAEGHVSANSDDKIRLQSADLWKSSMVPTPEWAGISCKAVTFQSIADLNQDSDDDEVDELASSVEDIEEFCEMTKSSPVQREQGKRSPGEGVAQETHHSAKAGEEQKLDQHNLEHQMSEIIMSAGSDEVIFTPPEGRSDPLPQRVASNQANLPLPQPTSSDAGVKSAHRDANGDGLKCATPQDLNKNSDFFMEERVIVMKPDGTPALLDGKNTKSTANPDKPRVPLTQLHTDSLAALVAFKRRKKQQDGKITDFFGQKHTRERAATPTTDRKNVNGYLVLRSRGDLVRTPPPKVTTPPVQQPASLKAESATLSPASTQTFSKDKIADNIRATPSLPLKPFQALSKAPNPAANAIPPEPEYDLTNLAPLKCFGSFRLLQNSAIDRALDLHNVEVIYPEEDDPVSLRAIALSKTNRQSVVPQITQPDIILSPRACLFFYRLSYIYQMTTVLDSDFNEKRMHHSKILLDALRLFSQEYDKIVLVFEMFEPAQDLKNKSNKPVMNATTITPAIKRALEKLHNDIGALAEEIQRPLGEELDIDLLHAISPLQAAAFVRERLDLRFAKDVQLGQLGWDMKLYEMFKLNDLSAHHLVIEAGSLEAFQEMDEEERIQRFLDVIGSEKLDYINRTIRSQAAFGTLLRGRHDTTQDAIADTYAEKDDDISQWSMQPRKSFTDSYYEDPNYAAYNYLPDSFSQANQTQNPEDSFVNARSMYHDNKRNDNMNITSYVQDESMMIYNSQMGSSSQHQQNQYDIDDLDELILDDADIEAEVNEAFEQDQIALSSPQNTDNRPFTPIHEIGNFWPQENNQAEGFPTGLTIIEPFNDAFAYGRQEETDELVHEFDDVLDTISEFDPDRHAPY